MLNIQLSCLQLQDNQVDPSGRTVYGEGLLPLACWDCAWSNPAGGMDVCLFWVLGVVRYKPLHRADH